MPVLPLERITGTCRRNARVYQNLRAIVETEERKSDLSRTKERQFGGAGWARFENRCLLESV